MEGTSPRRYPNRIRQIRMEKELTQTELAHIMGYRSTSSLSQIERGLKRPAFETMMKLQVALQRFIEDLYPRQFNQIRGTVGKRRATLFKRRGNTDGWS